MIDPLGFALENFDAVGAWRTKMKRGRRWMRRACWPMERKWMVRGRCASCCWHGRDDFAATVTENLMTYALGRGVEYYDQPAIRKIVREAEPSGERWSALVLGIVRSVPFEMRAPGKGRGGNSEGKMIITKNISTGARSCAARERLYRCRCSTA